MDKVVITGMGVVAANGKNKAEFAAALFGGKSGVGECTAFDTAGLSTKCFAQVAAVDSAVEKGSKSRFYALMETAAKEMLCDARLSATDIAAFGTRCRLFLGTLLYNCDAHIAYGTARARGESDASLARMNDFSAYAHELTGVQGAAVVCSSACASGTTAAGMALDYIRNGLCDCAVVGGVDALSIINAYGFNSLQALSPAGCKPYSAERDGITLGEGSAFFFFEKESHARARGAHIYAEVAGYALGNDAYHSTSPDPSGNGAFRTMSAALLDAHWQTQDLDYIDGHGTGSRINDDMETKAIARLMDGSEKEVALSSTKALAGHCMGASGAVELASVLVALEQGATVPLPALGTPMAHSECIRLSAKSEPLALRRALSCSFAFAGNSAAIAVQKAAGV